MSDSTLDLTQRLNGILDFLESSAKTAGQFAAEQTPLLIKEVLLFGFWINLIRLVVFLLTSYAVYRLARYHFSRAQELQKKKHPEPFAIFGFATVFGYAPALVILFLGSLWNAYNVLMISLAPRLYLIQYVADLVKR